MGKQKAAVGSMFVSDLFHVGIYKRNQGRLVRSLTFSALAITLLIAVWQLWALLQEGAGGLEYVIPGTFLVIGFWLSYRLVNFPRFADFLISVEAELNKVSWPSREELIRSSLVVIFMMFFLALVLFGFDFFWQMLFTWMGVIPPPPA